MRVLVMLCVISVLFGCNRHDYDEKTSVRNPRLIGLCGQKIGDVSYTSPVLNSPTIRHFSHPHLFCNAKDEVYAICIDLGYYDMVLKVDLSRIDEINEIIEQDTSYVIKLIMEKYEDVGVVKYKPKELLFDKDEIPQLFYRREDKDEDWYVMVEVEEPEIETRKLVVIGCFHDEKIFKTCVVVYDTALMGDASAGDKELL